MRGFMMGIHARLISHRGHRETENYQGHPCRTKVSHRGHGGVEAHFTRFSISHIVFSIALLLSRTSSKKFSP